VVRTLFFNCFGSIRLYRDCCALLHTVLLIDFELSCNAAVAAPDAIAPAAVSAAASAPADSDLTPLEFVALQSNHVECLTTATARHTLVELMLSLLTPAVEDTAQSDVVASSSSVDASSLAQVQRIACNGSSDRDAHPTVLLDLVRLSAASDTTAGVSRLRALLMAGLTAEATSQIGSWVITRGVACELLVQLISVWSTAQDDTVDVALEEEQMLLCKNADQTLSFLLEVALMAAGAHASLPSRLFPKPVIKMLLEVVTTTQRADLQLSLLKALDLVLKLDRHGVMIDATHTVSALLVKATAMYNSEAASRSDNMCFSPALQGFIALTLSLVNMFKLTGMALPSWFQAVIEFCEVMAFVQQGKPVASSILLDQMRDAVSASDFKKLHETIPGWCSWTVSVSVVCSRVCV
jgi:hypothetical protein